MAEAKINPDAFIQELKTLYPNFSFRSGPRFAFRPPKTIILGPPQPYFGLLTLHELGHGLSGLYYANTHISRLKIECRAWEKAKSLCLKHPEWHQKYQVSFDEDFAEASLDTYRDWLHQKSHCPKCGLIRAQDSVTGRYFCPACDLM